MVKPGDRVEVRVLKVDLEKKQISLSMRPAAERPVPEAQAGRPPERRPALPSGPPDGRGAGAVVAPGAPRRQAARRRTAALPSSGRPPPPRDHGLRLLAEAGGRRAVRPPTAGRVAPSGLQQPVRGPRGAQGADDGEEVSPRLPKPRRS